VSPEATTLPLPASHKSISTLPNKFLFHPLIPPTCPIVLRRTGFGRRDSHRTLQFNTPSVYRIFHLSWEHIPPQDRATLATATTIMDAYASLRQEASTADLSPLKQPRPPPDASPIDRTRARLLSYAFLRFDCEYGDLIRWLGGPYTDEHRDWAATFATLETVRDCPPRPDYPIPDFERTFRACTEGVPLRGNYVSDFNSCVTRNQAPLSADLLKNTVDVDETLRKEEKLSYHILLPRFLWRFFAGIFISIFRVAYRWGDPKPRLCVDPSTTLTPTDIGNVNRNIPDPGIDEDRNPTIYYGTALQRYLQWLYNLRISYPHEDILQMTDDISAAFHRVLYHPDMGPAFAAVWKEWLVIPVSSIFGARDAPGNYMRPGELRAHFGNFVRLTQAAINTPLIERLRLPPPPTPEEVATFVQATPDSINTGVAIRADGNPERRLSSFVDDTGTAHARDHFLAAAAASVHSAYVMFGHPDDDPNRPPCINPTKWNEEVFHHLTFLGYHIDSRRMTVSWPVDKRNKLRIFLDVLLDDNRNKRRSSPTSVSRVLGLVRHASFVAPMGTFRSLRLQHTFNDIVAKAPGITQLRRWYQRPCIRLPSSIISELTEFRSQLSDVVLDPYWTRPIGLLVPRPPTITVFSDASTLALGGWSRVSELNHMWRVTLDDLITAGLPANMGWNNPHNYHEPSVDPKAFHINVLELFAIFVELWISLRQLHAAHSSTPNPLAPAEALPPGGHCLLARADNTSALSWLRYASRTKRACIRRLVRLLTAFFCHPFPASHCRVQGLHIAGVANVSADHLSRYEKSPSWAAAMANSASLQNLRICLLPQELLSIIVSAFLHEQTEEWFATQTTRLWTVGPPVFVTGSQRNVASSSSVVPNP
jgi:hypothetical protein